MDDVDERDRRALAGESILFHEETVERRDGEFVSSLSSKIPLRDSTGDVNAVLTIAIDITDRKRTENVLREAKEVAELANRTKTDFLANMSHELRTPLNAVIGFSEIIHKQMFGPIGSERYREYARDIYESGTHLLNLINDILDVSKAEAGKIELHEEIVKIDRVIDASVRLIQERARDANLELTMPETSSLPAVRADERRLKQVLLNLLSNAVKFTPAGGRVAIAANTTADQGFSLQVSDTGIGIAEADIAKVLSPFGQVDSKLARKYEGTGLGLSLSKALVELHGGELTIDSTVGVGTTVTVTLPPERVVA
jgi:signal transduction histidine kinase